MSQKVSGYEAVDLSSYPQNEEGDRILPSNLNIEGRELYILNTGESIWSVGKDKNGLILASTSTKFYLNPDYECLWLR